MNETENDSQTKNRTAEAAPADRQAPSLTEMPQPEALENICALVNRGFSTSRTLAALWAERVEGKNQVFLYEQISGTSLAVVFVNCKEVGKQDGKAAPCKVKLDVYETDPAGIRMNEDLLWQALDRKLAREDRFMTVGSMVIHELPPDTGTDGQNR